MTINSVYLKNLFSFFEGWYARIISIMIIILIGFIIGRVAGRIVLKLLHDIEVDKIFKKAAGVSINIERSLSSFVAYFIYFITIITVLNQLNVTTIILQMISAAIIIVFIISVALAIKDFVPNMFAGFYIYRKELAKEGDIIKVKGMEGRVVEIGLVETKFKTKNGDMVHIPNSVLTTTEIIKPAAEAMKRAKKN